MVFKKVKKIMRICFKNKKTIFILILLIFLTFENLRKVFFKIIKGFFGG